MARYTLRLVRRRPASGASWPLAARPRVLYVLDGALEVRQASGATRVPAGQAWHGAGIGTARAAAESTVALEWDLAAGDAPAADGERLLEQAVDLDAAGAWLLRCDRVEFDPGGVALPHRHRGGGIRCLLTGSLDVTVGEAPPRLVRPGGSWYESGREPVRARASATEPTSFVRVSILPAEIRGQSSILYVDPADAVRGRPRRYTVLVDEPIALG